MQSSGEVDGEKRRHLFQHWTFLLLLVVQRKRTREKFVAEIFHQMLCLFFPWPISQANGIPLLIASRDVHRYYIDESAFAANGNTLSKIANWRLSLFRLA
eukprot:scaffold8427_cov108-Cylindrotheca_fusiformis.AAC.1